MLHRTGAGTPHTPSFQLEIGTDDKKEETIVEQGRIAASIVLLTVTSDD
jgi:hypothetical protein